MTENPPTTIEPLLTNSLAHKLATTKPRETAGSRSANRFDYQKNWAICELLNLHLTQNDYLLILDYHEDVVVLDLECTPTKGIFYQIKSKKTGNWTVNTLCKATKKKPDSYFKKLFSSYILFGDQVSKLIFITNQELNTKLKSKDSSLGLNSIEFFNFNDIDKEKIHESVEGDKSDKCSFYGLNLISIQKTDLPIDSSDTFTKGKLVDFFEKIAPEKKVSINIAYKTLFDEVKRKNNIENIYSDFNELKNAKGIGRDSFNQVVSTFTTYTSNKELWTDASKTLSEEGFNFSTIRRIKAAWGKYTIEIMNSFDDDINDIRSSILSEILLYEKKHQDFTLKELIQEINPKINFHKIPTLDNEPCINEAAIIYEVMDSEPVQNVNQKFKEKAV